MEAVAARSPAPWTPSGYSPPVASLSPELLLLASMLESRDTQTATARLDIGQAFERLEDLRQKIQDALERAREAQDSAGIWSDVSSLLGDDVATIAGVVASAAVIAGSGGAGAAVVLAAIAVSCTAGAEVADELGVDPELVMALKLVGAGAGLLGGGGAQAASLWSTIATVARAVQGGALAGGGAAGIVQGQYEGTAADERALADFFRGNEQLQQQLTDDRIAELEKLARVVQFLTQAASNITAQNAELDQTLISRIGG